MSSPSERGRWLCVYLRSPRRDTPGPSGTRDASSLSPFPPPLRGRPAAVLSLALNAAEPSSRWLKGGRCGAHCSLCEDDANAAQQSPLLPPPGSGDQRTRHLSRTPPVATGRHGGCGPLPRGGNPRGLLCMTPRLPYTHTVCPTASAGPASGLGQDPAHHGVPSACRLIGHMGALTGCRGVVVPPPCRAPSVMGRPRLGSGLLWSQGMAEPRNPLPARPPASSLLPAQGGALASQLVCHSDMRGSNQGPAHRRPTCRGSEPL